MPIWKRYTLAFTVEEALQALAAARGPARVIAGGTDLLLDLQQGRHPPLDTLVDVNAIPEMTVIELRQASLYIGAAVPLCCLVADARVRRHAQALVEACGQIGGPQVRNAATLGGNVAHALPAADGAIALTALDAQAEVASLAGRRRTPLAELYLGPGRSALDSSREILVGFYLPLLSSGQASAFQRVMRPQGVALPVLNMAIWLWRQGEMLADLRIAIGPAGPVPFRAHVAEAVLRGLPWGEVSKSRAREALLSEARFRTSPYRASVAYRQHLAGVLLDRLLPIAWERAALNDLITEDANGHHR